MKYCRLRSGNEKFIGEWCAVPLRMCCRKNGDKIFRHVPTNFLDGGHSSALCTPRNGPGAGLFCRASAPACRKDGRQNAALQFIGDERPAVCARIAAAAKIR